MIPKVIDVNEWQLKEEVLTDGRIRVYYNNARLSTKGYFTCQTVNAIAHHLDVIKKQSEKMNTKRCFKLVDTWRGEIIIYDTMV